VVNLQQIQVAFLLGSHISSLHSAKVHIRLPVTTHSLTPGHHGSFCHPFEVPAALWSPWQWLFGDSHCPRLLQQRPSAAKKLKEKKNEFAFPLILLRRRCCWCLVVQSCLTLATSWTVACQAPLSTALPRQEYWSGLPFPSYIYIHIYLLCTGPIAHVFSKYHSGGKRLRRYLRFFHNNLKPF